MAARTAQGLLGGSREDLINLSDGRSHYTGVLTLKQIVAGEISDTAKEYWLIEDHSYKLYHIFRSRRATSIKVLVYDGVGFWLATKRLSQGRFRWWPEGETARKLQAHQAQLLFAAGNPDLAAAPVWRKVS
jgi:hypothetical protein